MQLTLNLSFTPALRNNKVFNNTIWLDAGWAAACLGFAKKVEISRSLCDALIPMQTEDEDDRDQDLYDALWLAHHHLALKGQPSFSFTFDFLRDDKYKGRMSRHSLRLRLEERERVILLGLDQEVAWHSTQAGAGRTTWSCSTPSLFPPNNHTVICIQRSSARSGAALDETIHSFAQPMTPNAWRAQTR
jgi:hypothetical protein